MNLAKRRSTVKRHCVDCGTDISAYMVTSTVICFHCRVARSPEKTCQFCGVKFKALNSQACEPCRMARHIYSRFGSGRYLAGAEVAKARAKNSIPSPREFKCVDCGGRATEYDHRNYDEPLNVSPVCRGCNARRGSAKRKNWTFDEFWAWFNKGYINGIQGCKIQNIHQLTRDEMIPVARLHWDHIPPNSPS